MSPRYLDEDRFDLLRAGRVHDVTAVIDYLPLVRDPILKLDMSVASPDRLRPLATNPPLQASTFGIAEATLSSPVINPETPVALVNGSRHVEEIQGNRTKGNAALNHGYGTGAVRRVGLLSKVTDS